MNKLQLLSEDGKSHTYQKLKFVYFLTKKKQCYQDLAFYKQHWTIRQAFQTDHFSFQILFIGLLRRQLKKFLVLGVS